MVGWAYFEDVGRQAGENDSQKQTDWIEENRHEVHVAMQKMTSLETTAVDE